MAVDQGICYVNTSFGACGIGWQPDGIDLLQLPDRDASAMLARLQQLAPTRPLTADAPAFVLDAARMIQQYFSGDIPDFKTVPVVYPKNSSARKTYDALRNIPAGNTITYGELAKRSGHPNAARAVGRRMAQNPVPLIVPCHRVLPKSGGLGGFSAGEGVSLKARMLHLEGYHFSEKHHRALMHLSECDPKMKDLSHRYGPYLPLLVDPGDHYSALIEIILSQQVATQAAKTICSRFRKLTNNNTFPSAEKILTLSEEDFRATGISKQKASYIRDLAEKVLQQELPLKQLWRYSDEEVIQVLTKVRGLGRWSAQMFLLFQLKRLDLLPVDDLGFRNGLAELYGEKHIATADAMKAFAKIWQPYRSVACWYLWQSRSPQRRNDLPTEGALNV